MVAKLSTSETEVCFGPKRQSPPLQPGDRLTRAEFLRRYELLPSHLKAERIEGMVYMPAAAVSAKFHGEPHANIVMWLAVYAASTPGVALADNSTIALDIDNDPQPDACLRILKSHGGQSTLDANGYIEGAPELIVEITASSASYDLGAKLEAYRRNGVQEYIVHRTYDGELDWFVLKDGEYEQAHADAEGLIKSRIFPGLWLHKDSLLKGQLAEVLTSVQSGIASDEHRHFVETLAARKQTRNTP